MNGKESMKALFWLMVAIILIGDNNWNSTPALMGIGIIIYLAINTLILSADEDKTN